MPGKRKSDASTKTSSSKKSKTSTSSRENEHASAKAILALASVNKGLEQSNSEFDFGDEIAVQKAFAEIANHVGSLEDEVEKLKEEVKEKREKLPEQIEIEAKHLRQNVVRGIQKLLTVCHYLHSVLTTLFTFQFFVCAVQWKPSCKMNSAKYAYDGICPDPLVFGAMLGLDGPPKFKMKKMLGSEFQSLIGEQIIGSARYNDLYISRENVNIRYDAQTGEFKNSGSYGINP